MPDKGTWALCTMMAITGATVVAITFAATSKSRVRKTSGYAVATALVVASVLVVFLGPAPLHAAKLWAGLLVVATAWLGFRAVSAHRVKLDLATIETFEKWSALDAAPPQETMKIQGPPSDALHKDVKEKLLKERPTDVKTVLSLEGLPIELQDVLSNAQQSFGVVKLVGNNKSALTLYNATIWRLEVLQGVPKLSLTGCRIGQIASYETSSFEVRNCLIGRFTVLSKVRNLDWRGGYLGQFDFVGERSGVFVGDTTFRSITLPYTDSYHGVQSIRDAREALNARNNYVAAGLFHAAELKLTRPKKWLDKVSSAYWWTSLGYQAGSDFGNSIGRPIACFMVTMLALVALAYEIGTNVARKDEELHGWQLALKDDEFLRAAQYAVQSINPLNLFGSPLVVMSHKWGAIAGGTLGVIGISAFALFFLSVRRRFKLD